jgi:hypothetical protein
MTLPEELPFKREPDSGLPSDTHQVIELAELVLMEAASAQNISELESLIANDHELRRVYLRYVLVHGQLALTSIGLPEMGASHQASREYLAPSPSPSLSMSTHPYRILRWTAIAATVLWMVFVGIYLVGSQSHRFRTTTNRSVLASNETATEHYDNRALPVHVVGVLETDRSQSISPTTLTVHEGAARLTTTDGIDVQIEGPAMFGASSRSEGVLFEGSVHASLTRPDTNYSIQTSSLRVADRGTNFRVSTMDDDRIRVDVMEGEVEVQARVRSPLYYWSFDDDGSDGNEAIAIQPKAELRYFGAHIRQSPGLVGSGALVFANRNEEFVRVETGAGIEVGTGGLACSSGISIEALVVCGWSGQSKDYDEIFRKDDGIHRMLLSFQNDGDSNDFDFPKVVPGPCLSFGLHLEKHGYSELDMPLDGQECRPSIRELTDGNPHHVVATYDSFSGRKAIYVDGRLRFSHHFPVGTMILNGGPSPVVIGNHNQKEPFTGIIDEVAFYDFALSPSEVSDHHQRAMRGETYFSTPSALFAPGRWQLLKLVSAGSSQLFDARTHQ